MTTLLVSEVFPPKTGGSGRWLWEVYRRLPSKEFLIVAGSDPRPEVFGAGHEARLIKAPLSFPTRLVRRQSLSHYLSALRLLRSLSVREKVGMVHCARCLPEGLLAASLKLRTGIPYACFVHGEEANLSNAVESPPWYSRRVYGSRELGLVTGLVLRGAQFLIANSENTRSILTERWRLPAGRVRLLYPGVDCSRFRPAPRNAGVRRRLGWGERPVVLTVGRLQKRKGQDMMIAALAAIRGAIPDVLYAIVGTGEELVTLQRLVGELGLGEHVLLHGEIDDEDLVHCYQQCDLFVLPNRQIGGDIEGFGMVLLEAQACGRPVVAGASGGTAETMRIGETGLLVSCDRPDELAAVVSELLRDPKRREKMGSAARHWVASRFDWEPLSREARALFELERTRAPR